MNEVEHLLICELSVQVFCFGAANHQVLNCVQYFGT